MEEVGEADGADLRGEVAGDVGGGTTPAVPSNINRSLILLNHFLPEENKSMRVTIEEMRNWLVHYGVDKLLSVDLLAQALQNANRGFSILTQTFMGKIKFYRPWSLPVNLVHQRISAHQKMAHPTGDFVFHHHAPLTSSCIPTEMLF